MTRARSSSVALLLTAALASLLTAALTTVAVLAPATTASAHDQLTGTDPEDGATVEAPDTVELTFSGAIGDLGAQVAVTDADGRSVVEGPPQVAGTVVEQDLAEDLAAGDYAVVWRVTSQDGHPISGEFFFSVEAEEDDAQAEADASAAAQAEADASAEASAEAAARATGGSGVTGSDGDDDGTEPATEEASTGASTGTGAIGSGATDDADVTADPAGAEGVGGLPVWAWVVIALAAAGLLGLLARTWTRGRE